MKLHDAIIKFPPKKWDGEYGEFLHAKVRLNFGFEVDINCCNIDDDFFLSFTPGEWIHLYQYRDATGGLHTKPYRGTIPHAPQMPEHYP